MAARRPLLIVRIALLAAIFGGCNFFEDGRWVPEDPGDVRASVRDDVGAVVSGTLVEVEIPNDVGGVFRIGRRTGSDGSATLHGVPAGIRPVFVTPPAGYEVSESERTRTIEVQYRRTTDVSFTLRRVQ